LVEHIIEGRQPSMERVELDGNPCTAQGTQSVSLLKRYQPLVGARASERLLKKARRLDGLKVLHVNSTRQGGGVAEILSSVTPLMNSIGIDAQWPVIDGSPEFFARTKDIHNGLQGDPIEVEAFTIASKQRPARLVLVGNTAADDPEGPAMYESIRAFSNDRVLIRR
jgi:hypothetical protein